MLLLKLTASADLEDFTVVYFAGAVVCQEVRLAVIGALTENFSVSSGVAVGDCWCWLLVKSGKCCLAGRCCARQQCYRRKYRQNVDWNRLALRGWGFSA